MREHFIPGSVGNEIVFNHNDSAPSVGLLWVGNCRGGWNCVSEWRQIKMDALFTMAQNKMEEEWMPRVQMLSENTMQDV